MSSEKITPAVLAAIVPARLRPTVITPSSVRRRVRTAGAAGVVATISPPPRS